MCDNCPHCDCAFERQKEDCEFCHKFRAKHKIKDSDKDGIGDWHICSDCFENILTFKSDIEVV